MIIAIDGPAASGKGTLAKRLAKAFGLPHLDTGLLYRATARAVLVAGRDIADREAAIAAAVCLEFPDPDDGLLRTREMGEAASVVAAVPEVRAALLDLQRTFAHRPFGAVLDGRDIGTVICPDADAKIFVVASPEVRAHRRALELAGRGEHTDYEAVLADIKRRDERDSGRTAAPLRAAPDAETVDTTHLDIEGSYAKAFDIVTRHVERTEGEGIRSSGRISRIP